MRYPSILTPRSFFAWLAALVISTTMAFAQTSDKEAPAELRSGAQDVINGQINAFKARDHEKAFGFAAPNLKQLFGSTDRFIGMVKKGYGAIYGADVWSFGRSRFHDETLYQEVLLRGPNGRDWVALYTLRRNGDGEWNIHGVQMKPAEGRST